MDHPPQAGHRSCLNHACWQWPTPMRSSCQSHDHLTKGARPCLAYAGFRRGQRLTGQRAHAAPGGRARPRHPRPGAGQFKGSAGVGIRRTSYGSHATGLHTLAPDRHNIGKTASGEPAMSLHYYVKKAWQDDMLRAADRDRLAVRARRARPSHQGRAGPARGRRTLRMLSRDLLIVLTGKQCQRRHEMGHHMRRQLPPERFAPLPAAATAASTASLGTAAASTPGEIQSVRRPPAATTPLSATTSDHAGPRPRPADTRSNLAKGSSIINALVWSWA